MTWNLMAGTGVLRLLLCLAFLLPGCATPPLPPASLPAASQNGDRELLVAKRDWHTEIGLRTSQISGPLASLGPAALGRKYLLVGFGARDYFTVQDAGMDQAMLALLSATSAIQLAAFDDLHDNQERSFVRLHVSQESLDRITSFIWKSLDKNGSGAPVEIVTRNSASVFYGAHPDYDAFYNCNDWAADVLRAGGLSIDSSGILLSSGIFAQARGLAALQAPPLPVNTAEK